MRFAVLLFIAQIAFGADNPVPDVHNFIKVNDHIYRGAEPSAVGVQELGAMGVKIVLDLREAGAGAEAEQREVEKLHIKYINLPMKPFSAPTKAEMERALSILMNSNGSDPVFVHCRRGKDRTGTVIACYRIQHDGWTNIHALEEAKSHGMSFAERSMRAYILHFKPFTDFSVLAAGR
jgi:protein tyrosine/serine phosphatase